MPGKDLAIGFKISTIKAGCPGRGPEHPFSRTAPRALAPVAGEAVAYFETTMSVVLTYLPGQSGR